MAPASLVEALTDCFTAFDAITDKYNLEKIKTIGDSYMCVGGVPTANDTNPVDAVSAATEMMQWMNSWKSERDEKGLPSWRMRIGIHSGELMAGVIGKKKFHYDVYGDAVNVASRIESSGKSGRINLSSSTYELVKDQFNCEYRGEIETKNRGKIGMYFVHKPS